MSTAVQLRRGTTTQHASFTGALGEVTVDTTKDTIVVHDGTTVGGFPLVAADDVGVTVVGQTAATGAINTPAGTTGERPTGVTGRFRFNTTLSKPEVYNGTAWGSVGGGATGGGSDEIFIENGQTVNTSYSIPSLKNAMSTGPISVASGISVTVPSGSRWVVL
jgi:hypothetical protein